MGGEPNAAKAPPESFGLCSPGKVFPSSTSKKKRKKAKRLTCLIISAPPDRWQYLKSEIPTSQIQHFVLKIFPMGFDGQSL